MAPDTPMAIMNKDTDTTDDLTGSVFVSRKVLDVMKSVYHNKVNFTDQQSPSMRYLSCSPLDGAARDERALQGLKPLPKLKQRNVSFAPIQKEKTIQHEEKQKRQQYDEEWKKERMRHQNTLLVRERIDSLAAKMRSLKPYRKRRNKANRSN